MRSACRRPARRACWLLLLALLVLSCLERVDLDALPFACNTDRVCRAGHVCDMKTRTCVADERDAVAEDGEGCDGQAGEQLCP